MDALMIMLSKSSLDLPALWNLLMVFPVWELGLGAEPAVAAANAAVAAVELDLESEKFMQSQPERKLRHAIDC